MTKEVEEILKMLERGKEFGEKNIETLQRNVNLYDPFVYSVEHSMRKGVVMGFEIAIEDIKSVFNNQRDRE